MRNDIMNGVPKDTVRWLYEALHLLAQQQESQNLGFQAIIRGELPDGSGIPVVDTSKFFYKPGLPGGQVAFGGKNPGDPLVLGSTSSPTKDRIFFGAARASVYDEVNERWGFNEDEPAARLHITESSAGGTTEALPAPTVFLGGWGALGSSSDLCVLLQTADGATNAIQGSDTTTSTACRIGWITPTDPGDHNGWKLIFNMAKTMTGNGLGATMDFRATHWNGSSFDTGTQILGRNILLMPPGVGNDIIMNDNIAYADYEIALTSGEAATMFSGTHISVTLTNFGSGRTDQVIRISQMRITGPGLGDSTPLQRWESSGGVSVNDLSFDSDGGSAEDLAMTGDAPLRIGSGGGTSGVRILTSGTDGCLEAGTAAATLMNMILSGTRGATGTEVTSKFLNHRMTGTIEINGGSPAAGKILESTDTDGLARWTAGTIIASTWPYTSVSSMYAITPSDGVVDCSGTFTVTLPTAVGVAGRLYTIKNSGTGTITVATTGGQTIDGGATAVLQVRYVSITVVSDGANWKVI